MKRIVRLTESDLHKLVKESVKKILNEGLASQRLKKSARQHGGIRSVNKKYQLDKNNFDYDLIFMKRGESIPWKLEQFVDDVCEFKDGSKYIILKPEYQRDPKIKEKIESVIKQSEELAANRSAGFKPGTVTDYSDLDDWGDPTKKKLTADGMRQWQHKKNRGKSPAELPRKNNEFRDEHGISQTGDYDEYVKNFLCDKFNGFYVDYHIAVPTPEDGRWGEEASKIVNEFKKYGYGWDESFGNSDIDYAYDWADERTKDRFNPDIDYMGFEKGKSRAYIEWDDPGPFGYSASNPYGSFESSKMKDTPRIGTSEFMKKNQ